MAMTTVPEMSDLYRRLLEKLTATFGGRIDDANADAIAYAAAALYHRDFEPRLWQEKSTHDLLDMFGVPRAGVFSPYSLTERVLIFQRRSTQAQYVNRAHELLTALGVPRQDETGTDQSLKWRLDRFLGTTEGAEAGETHGPEPAGTEGAAEDIDPAPDEAEVDDAENDDQHEAGPTEDAPKSDAPEGNGVANGAGVANGGDATAEPAPDKGGAAEPGVARSEAPKGGGVPNEAGATTTEGTKSEAAVDQRVAKDEGVTEEQAAVDGGAVKSEETKSDVADDQRVVEKEGATEKQAGADGAAEKTEAAADGAGGAEQPGADGPAGNEPLDAAPAATAATDKDAAGPVEAAAGDSPDQDKAALSMDEPELVGLVDLGRSTSAHGAEDAQTGVDVDAAPGAAPLVDAVRALEHAARVEAELSQAAPVATPVASAIDVGRLTDTVKSMQAELAALRTLVDSLGVDLRERLDVLHAEILVAQGPLAPEAMRAADEVTQVLPPVAPPETEAADGHRAGRRILLVMLLVLLGLIVAGAIVAGVVFGWDQIRSQFSGVVMP
jgi:hypothetical protein